MEDGKITLGNVISSVNLNRQELAANLLPSMVEILAQAGWSKTSLDAIVVGNGPGSFTSIRSAVVVARTLSYSLKLPLIGISQFEVIASYFSGPIGIVLPAYRNFIYAAAMELSPAGNTQILIEPQCVELDSLAKSLTGVDRCVLPQDAAGLLDIPNMPGITLIPLPTIKNTATKQAEIASNRLSLNGKGGSADALATEFPWKLVRPLYLREPSVTLKA
jgi:tRNA threonylcarbamoyl adenosine modification protein YeaZ